MGKKMNHKAQIKMMQQIKTETQREAYANNMVEQFILNALLVLGDKFGFGKTRMERFLECLSSNTFAWADECKVGTITTSEEILNILKDEYKLDFYEVVDKIQEKRKGEISNEKNND